jgi:hypothetical protein
MILSNKCNRKNVEYLIGSDRIGKISGLSDAIDWDLSEYPWPEGALSGGDVSEGLFPGVCIIALPHPDGTFGKYETRSKVGHDEPCKRAGVPRMAYRVVRPNGTVKFQSEAPLLGILRTDDLAGTYTVYRHGFGSNEKRLYFGITRQGWAARWKQHLCAANNGSPYLFHQAIRTRDQSDASDGDFHRVVACGLSYEDAMNLEEELVAKQSLYPHGLNMIPGGFAGIRYLGQRGFHGVTPKNWEYRSRLLREFSKYCDRSGKPNPLLAAVWKDDDYAASVICSNPNNFDLERVREARLLSSFDWTPEQIAERFSCKPERVQRLLRGATYARVH